MTWWAPRILRHAPIPPRPLVGIGILTVAGSALVALTPWPMKLLVDVVLRPNSAVQEQNRWLFSLPGAAGSTTILTLWMCGSMVLLYCISQAVRVYHSYLLSGLGSTLVYRLGADLLARLQEMSLIFHSRQRLGDLVRRVTSDAACARELVCGVILPAARSMVHLVVIFVFMWTLNRTLALVAIVIAAPLIVLMRVFSKPLSERAYERQEVDARLYSLAEQTLGAIPVVQSFTREPEQDRRYRELSDQSVRAAFRSMLAELQFKFATSGITAIGTGAIMLLGGLHVIDGRMTIGGLLVFLAYLSSLYAPLETMAYLSMAYANAAGNARRVLEVLDNTDRVTESSTARSLPTTSSRNGLPVRFDHVTFGYTRPEAVLQSINLDVAAGQVVALVGPTGAGKSTMASLVPRLLDPWEGRVCLADVDVRELTLASLRDRISIVPQEPMLLPISIAENIAYGRPGAKIRDLRAAAEAANAAEFIERLPSGYDTVVGERGATLSVGQRQRLSIARALLKDAPVLVLDEPTSALDAATEHSVVTAMQRLLQGRTCLIIAHRLSTIRNADRIVVLEAGRIAQDGKPAELISAPGLYQQMYSLQGLTSTPPKHEVHT